MRLRSFQMRILLWTWGLMIVALGVSFYYATTLVGKELVEETEQRTWQELETVKWLMEQHDGLVGEKDFSAWLERLGSNLGTRISYIYQGRVIADSEVPYAALDTLDDHSSRPEVISANVNGRGSSIRYSDTLQTEMVYVAAKVIGPNGQPPGVLRLSVPFSEVNARLSLMRTNFLWIFLGVIVCSALVCGIMSRNMAREITDFSQVARSIGEGDYATRLRAVPGGEFQPLAQSVNAMAQSIERNVRIIEDQKGQLQAIFDGMREGVLTLSAEGRIEAFNDALAAMFNLPGSTVGRTPIEATRRYELQDMVDQLLEDPDHEDMVMQIDLMDNRTVEVSGVPFFDHRGENKVILVFYDITAMKRSEKGLKDFVANASHQLRTPLTSIKGYTETLLDNPPAKMEDGKFFLETVLKNADHMDKVISSMLALAKSEQVGKRLSLAPLSGREFMSRTVDDVTPWAAERDITLHMRAPGDECLVMGESDGLLHVFHNLLNNAIKYSPEGGRITVSAEDDGESVVFCVEDQGPGISREHSTKVFERFYRVDENTIDSSGSAGLGLAICRRIVHNFGGDIWHDGYGEGTQGARFCFRLNKPAFEQQ